MKIAVIGCGAMGGSIAKKLASQFTVNLYDPHPEKMEAIPNAIPCDKPSKAIQGADIVILAVKPKHLEKAAYELAPLFQGRQILVSVLGSSSLADLVHHFGEIPLVRAMPNLPVELGKGVVGLSAESLSSEEKASVDRALSPLGSLHWTTEPEIEALTALAGSGPGLISILIESMIDAGVAMGLSAPMARKLALETINGTTALLENPALSPSELKWRVASPGGITIAGIQELEAHAVRGAIMNSFLAVYDRLQ